MRSRSEIGIWGAVVVASVGLHAMAFGGLGGRADGFGRKNERRATLVEMSVAKPREVPPPPLEPPKPATKPATKSAPRVAMARPARAAAPRPSAPPPPAAARPPAAEAAADFTGVTLTNDGAGPGWASATGDGQSMRGPVGPAGPRVTRRVVDGDAAAQGRRAGPPTVGIADLSRPPVAPDLTAALARAYPDDARQKGIAGRATVRARVMPDGHVREIALLSETGAGFGAACRRTLEDSVWSAPLDREAHPVSTFIHYSCRFEVQ